MNPGWPASEPGPLTPPPPRLLQSQTRIMTPFPKSHHAPDGQGSTTAVSVIPSRPSALHREGNGGPKKVKSPGEGAASQLRAGRTGVQARYFSALKYGLLGFSHTVFPRKLGSFAVKMRMLLKKPHVARGSYYSKTSRDPTPSQVCLCLKALAGPFSRGLPFPTFFPDDLPLKF